jgi:hypothetical protein
VKAVPHFPQYLKVKGLAAPQAEQDLDMMLPHLPQNRLSGGFSNPQLEQIIVFHKLKQGVIQRHALLL